MRVKVTKPLVLSYFGTDRSQFDHESYLPIGEYELERAEHPGYPSKPMWLTVKGKPFGFHEDSWRELATPMLCAVIFLDDPSPLDKLIAAAERLLDVIAEPIEIVRENDMDNAIQALSDAITETKGAKC